MNDATFIFVYNADSGKWNGYMDILHKVFSPKTYPCHLCDITYGTFSIREPWKAFVEQYPIPIRFLHRDEWVAEFQRQDALPAIFVSQGGNVRLWLSPEEMSTMDLDALMARLEAAAQLGDLVI